MSSSESGDMLSSLAVSRRSAHKSDARAGEGRSVSSPAASPSSAGGGRKGGLARANRERAALSASLNKSQSVQEQMSAYMKKTALVVSERVEDGAAVMVKALRGPEHDHSEQIDDVQLASLDYDNFLDYVYDKQLEDDATNSGRHRIVLLLLRFAITVLIAFVTAMLMYFVNTVVRWASAKRIDTTVQLIATGYEAAAYFSFVFASIAITAVAAFMCTVIAPHARGGGVPYLFAYLNGTNVYEYFTFRIVAVKVCALAFTIAGGLTLGMEGPFVYIGRRRGAAAVQRVGSAACRGERAVQSHTAQHQRGARIHGVRTGGGAVGRLLRSHRRHPVRYGGRRVLSYYQHRIAHIRLFDVRSVLQGPVVQNGWSVAHLHHQPDRPYVGELTPTSRGRCRRCWPSL